MVIRDNEDMDFKNVKSDCEDITPFEDCTNEEVAYLVEDKALVIDID
jgi:hypothetical protein